MNCSCCHRVPVPSSPVWYRLSVLSVSINTCAANAASRINLSVKKGKKKQIQKAKCHCRGSLIIAVYTIAHVLSPDYIRPVSPVTPFGISNTSNHAFAFRRVPLLFTDSVSSSTMHGVYRQPKGRTARGPELSIHVSVQALHENH